MSAILDDQCDIDALTEMLESDDEKFQGQDSSSQEKPSCPVGAMEDNNDLSGVLLVLIITLPCHYF